MSQIDNDPADGVPSLGNRAFGIAGAAGFNQYLQFAGCQIHRHLNLQGSLPDRRSSG